MIDFQEESNIDFQAESITADFKQDQTQAREDRDSSYVKQVLGAWAKGGMRLSRGLMSIPKHTFWAGIDRFAKKEIAYRAGMTPEEFDAKFAEAEAAGVDKPTVIKAKDKISKEYNRMVDDHKSGMNTIIRNHPEWESEPPENFLDLLTSPRKLSLAIAESTPVLVAAGITGAAGQPALAYAMMYSTEGQEASDQAIEYGATEEQAEAAYHIYGSVAAVLENMQLKGIIKVGKGSYAAVLNRAAQKVAQKGGKTLKREILEVSVKEAAEEVAQGTWQEIVAMGVYDKPIEGGVTGFVDRRLQEALIGFTMGVVPGTGGAVAGKVAQKQETEQRRAFTNYVTAKGEASKVYATAKDIKSGKPGKTNVHVIPKGAQSKGEELLIQFSSDLLTEGQEDPVARNYYDKLHKKRSGYQIPGDFWEVPAWIPTASNIVTEADMYVIRDVEQAKEFLANTPYKKIFFSALDVNKNFIKDIAKDFDGEIIVGGYIDKTFFDDTPNVKFYDSMQSMAEAEGYDYKEGVDFKHFKDSKTQPRLCMSEGCLHKCAFCAVPKNLIEKPKEAIDQQIEAMKDLDFELVYLDDKTFGQAKNFEYLTEAYNKLKKQNPNFKGFIIQTTAAQFNKMDDAFLNSGIVKYVELGVESYNDEILKEAHKPANEKTIQQAADKIRAHSMSFIPNIIIGLPQETAQTYQNTLDFLEKNKDIISHVNVYNLALYAGTELGDSIQDKTDIDVNENTVAKSFHKNPQLHIDFAEAVYEFSSKQLDSTPSVAREVTYEQEKYDKLLEKAQAGNKNALRQLNEMVQKLDVPTYEDLLAKVEQGDENAAYAIQQELYRGGKAEAAAREPAKPKKKTKPLTKKRLFHLGHDIPRQLDWTEEQRRKFMKKTTGKESMKDMSKVEKKKYIEALNAELEKAGVELEEKVSEKDQVLEALVEKNDVTEDVRPVEELEAKSTRSLRRQIASLASNFYQNFIRVERMLEALDNFKKGPIRDLIWKPIKQADEVAIETTNLDLQEFYDTLEKMGIDPEVWLASFEKIPGTKLKLTKSQKVGVAMLSRNERGMEALKKEMGLTEAEILDVVKSLDATEKKLMGWFEQKYEQQWPIILEAAKQAGIDPDTLKKEYRYAPLLKTDRSLEEQDDFLHELAMKVSDPTAKPEQGFLKKRKPGAKGAIELDAFIMYMQNVTRVDRFIAMAPAAHSVGKILNSRQVKAEISKATHGHGNKILSQWLKDSIRGKSESPSSFIGKTVSILRRNGVIYAIGDNVLSALRQPASMVQAIATDPKMQKYVPINLIKSATDFQAMEDFVHSKSLLVKTRQYDRDLRKIHDRKQMVKAVRGKRLSPRSMAMIRFMDRRTVVVAWKSAYDVAMEKNGGNEKAAVEYADDVVNRTQPMANAKDLPAFFRGGQLEKLLTTFQNQINQNGNFYTHDIVGMRRAGKISNTEVAYRVLWSYVIPALLFGVVGRGRLPKKISEVAVDLTTYLVAPIVFVGRVIDRLLKGFSGTGSIAEIGVGETVKTVTALKEGKPGKAAKHGIKAFGAFTGKITAAQVRAAEGVYDIATGETKDPRRLIYSQWALDQGKEKKSKKIERKF